MKNNKVTSRAGAGASGRGKSDRKRSDAGRSTTGRKPYERKRREDKPYDGERKPYERKNREEGTSTTGRKPYERKRREDKPYDRDKKPYERRKREDGASTTERKPYERKRREDKPYDGERRSYAEPFEFKRKPAIRNRKKKADSDNMGDVRLNKFIANSGICSRREADEYIEAGLITVNGVVVTQLGIKINPDKDDIRFNGERLKGEPKTYIIMNKPKDFVTTLSDPNAEKTVMDLIGDKCPQRVYPVGRLDKQTTGVLLFTNDGELTEKLTHPSNNQKKIYHVFLDRNLSTTDFDAILDGIELEDGHIYADALSYVDGEKDQLGLEIHSGRNRVVRRIFEHLGYKVKKLDRVYFAGLTKKNLKRGQWRFLTEQEITMLQMGAYE